MSTEKAKLDESEKIWEEISVRPIEVYALSGQTVSQHVTKLVVPGKTLFLKLKSSSVLPALEACLGSKYLVEVAEGYVCVKRNEDQTEAVREALKKLQQ